MKTIKEHGHNGYKNYETWNIALWINNDEGLYTLAKECKDYADFIDKLEENRGDGYSIGWQTPDGVSWNDSGLDTKTLNRVIKETRE